MDNEFLASRLTSRDLIALLFVCEMKRKQKPPSDEEWGSLLSIFSDRLKSLSEPMRLEVLEAHLMSVEDIDIYNNETLAEVLSANEAELTRLKASLAADPRFEV